MKNNLFRSASVAVLMLVISALGVASASAETFQLDGKDVGQAAAIEGSLSGGCASVPSSEGVTACFSSDRARRKAVAADMRANRVPPGFRLAPSAQEQTAFLNATGISIASKKAKRRTARVAATCTDASKHWNNTYQSGYYGYYYSSQGAWLNYGSGFNNQISSAQTSGAYHAYYHDGANGSGAYYSGGANYCHLDNTLGSWDNRFTSFQTW